MMMSVWHLLWIVPVSAFVGMLLTALVSANRYMDEGDTNGRDKT